MQRLNGARETDTAADNNINSVKENSKFSFYAVLFIQRDDG